MIPEGTASNDPFLTLGVPEFVNLLPSRLPLSPPTPHLRKRRAGPDTLEVLPAQSCRIPGVSPDRPSHGSLSASSTIQTIGWNWGPWALLRGRCPQGSDCREVLTAPRQVVVAGHCLGGRDLQGLDWRSSITTRLSSSHRREEEGVMGSKAIVWAEKPGSTPRAGGMHRRPSQETLMHCLPLGYHQHKDTKQKTSKQEGNTSHAHISRMSLQFSALW